VFNFQQTFHLPFKSNIPNYIQTHIEQVSVTKRMIKFLRRYVYIFLKRQKNLEIFSILPEHKKILWINISAPSLGDSLMDLSSRVMLTNREVDLFTDKKNYHLYLSDKYFNSIFTKSNELKNLNYDLVIIDSYSSRSVKIKAIVAPKTFFVGIYGFFNGPEVNRILFSFHKMNHLLGKNIREDQINSFAKNSISISQKDYEIINNIVPKEYIAIVLGGEWEYKIYNKWDKVIEKILLEDKGLKIIFIGSSNAKNTAKELLKKYPERNILDFVERLSFNQSVEVVRRAKVLLCCDGGIMHAANAVGSNSVVLYARLTPEMLITNSTKSYNLFDKIDVNKISSKRVLEKYFEAFHQN
jgi:ADP-heptose:LPS heptosyltransferase